MSRYNGPDNYFDFAHALAVDQTGNVYVTGESRYVGSTSHYATVKYDANGNQLWAARLAGQGSGQNIANALALDAAGNAYVTGESDSDCVTIKYDANGNRLWLTRYGTSDWDTGLAVATDLAGFVYVAGDASRSEGDDLDCVVIKHGQTEVSGLPVIAAPPQAQMVSGGAHVELSVSASSASPLSYQWYQDGSLVAGATNASLAIPNARWEDHGSYWVTVGNAAGILVTPEARVAVQVAPRFTKHPQSHYSGTGIFVTLAGEAVGTPLIGYQWQHSGTNVTDAHALSLNLGEIQPASGGFYQLVATNAFGAATSDVAAVIMELSAPLNAWETTVISTNLFNLRAVYQDRRGGVVVGNSGAIFTLGIGPNWISRNSRTAWNLHRLTWANGLYLTVGSGGTILTSPDLETWPPQASLTTEALFGIATGAGGRVVVVGDNGTVLSSTNGLTWISQNSGTTEDLHGVVLGNGLFVAVGKHGSQWRRQTNGVVGTALQSDLKAAAWCDGQFVAVGEQGVVLTSPDAPHWAQQSSGTSENLNDVAYGEGVIAIVGDGQSEPGVILTSTDGAHWVLRKSGTNKNLRAVTWGDGNFIVAANDSTVAASAAIAAPSLAAFNYRPSLGMEFQVFDDIIRPLRVQASTDLRVWVDLFSGAAAPPTNLVDAAATNLSFRFYRTVSP